MTESIHPMQPSNELMTDALTDALIAYPDRHVLGDLGLVAGHVGRALYAAGADAELEACMSFLAAQGWDHIPSDLRAARRPKLPSLKEQAQRILVENGMTTDGRLELDGADLQVIQAALLRLPD